ncbi:MAG: hypothetical protein WB762_19175 [Candidatus Sulfotelmatobacter sp.]
MPALATVLAWCALATALGALWGRKAEYHSRLAILITMENSMWP